MQRDHLEITKKLQKRSKFFCPAKWTELYLYLNHGNTNSCHHPIPQQIPLEELEKNVSALHNTKHKIQQRQLMLDGERPPECHMCWSLEDADDFVLSDRIHKSRQWEKEIEVLDVDPNYVPKFIEVVFDNTCNLSCSYCDSGQSSTWANHIKRNPVELQTDYRELYSKVHIQPGSVNEIYNAAWRSWFSEIKYDLKELKVSGGEPLLSKNFWNFMDDISDLNHMNFSINSNLSVRSELVDKLISYESDFASLKVSASIDAIGDIAEYSRQGLDYNLFLENCFRYLDNTNHATIKLQGTVNALSIFGLTDMIDLNIMLRKKYGDRIRSFYATMVRFPEFQSIHILPDNIKVELENKLSDWYLKNSQLLYPYEQDLFNKILTYLKEKPKMLIDINYEQLKADFCKFIKYYDGYSNKKFEDIYPANLVQWVNNA